MSLLKLAAGMVGMASLLHIMILFGGADWYRFFGAGEAMATLSEQGSSYPTLITATIAAVLATWSVYGLSGAGLLPKLPLRKIVLAGIASIFLLRGALAIPVVLVSDSPYMQELADKMTFMMITSLICLFIGTGYAVGTYRLMTADRK